MKFTNTILALFLTSGAANAASEIIDERLKGYDKQKRYIVMFAHGDKAATVNDHNPTQRQVIQNTGGTAIMALPSIKATVALLTDKQKDQLSSDGNVIIVEEDQERQLSGLSSTNQYVPTSHFLNSTSGSNATWAVNMIEAPLVDDSQSGSQKICLIDTGYDINHPDLPSGPNITGEVSNTLRVDYDLGVWSEDAYGHGTHMAGTMVALKNGVGIEGILPNNHVKIHNVKVIHNSNYWRIWASDLIAAVEQCRQAGSTVINMSIAGLNSSIAERQAMSDAYENGVMLVAASGNWGSSSYFYPASYDSVISVGGVDQSKNAWMFTQKNDQTEIVAPGYIVRSTIPNNNYRNWDGTSISTAHVSGVAALLWSNFPQCSNQQIRNALRESAEDLGDPDLDFTFGYGLIRAKAAFDYLTNEGCNKVFCSTNN